MLKLISKLFKFPGKETYKVIYETDSIRNSCFIEARDEHEARRIVRDLVGKCKIIKCDKI